MIKLEKIIRGRTFMQKLFETCPSLSKLKSSGAYMACVNGKRSEVSIKELKQSAPPIPF